jgi:hypothetical protein
MARKIAMSYFPTGKHTYANVTVPLSGNTSNVTLTGGTGLTYTTATGASTWATGITIDPYYTKKPRVEITDQDLVIDGLSVKETMLAIKNELMIPTRINRNDILEQEFTELKAAAEHYHELEQKFLEQKAMWATLKT